MYAVIKTGESSIASHPATPFALNELKETSARK